MTKEDLQQIGELIDSKLEPIKTDLTTLKQDLSTVKNDLHGLTVDMADYFHQTWEKMDKTDERVTIIEDHLGLENPHKN